ncbi:MAG: T9SS type A sorting domain-containing protein [Bacteroidales bacterium]
MGILDEDIQTIRIYNQAGQAIKMIEVGGLSRKIDVSNLTTGVYIMTIETSYGLISKRFIVE